MRWFRLYTEVADDPKAQRLSGDLFKFWITSMCLCARNDGKLPSVADLSWKMHLSASRVSDMLAKLYEAGLLERSGDTFTPHNWLIRQYKSDSSTPRVKRFRERVKEDDGTFHETDGKRYAKRDNAATVTPPDTETDTDTDNPLTAAKNAALPTVISGAEKRNVRDSWLDRQHDEKYWPRYWNRDGKAESRRAFRKQVKAMVHGKEFDWDAAVAFLCEAIESYRVRFEHTESWSWRRNMHSATLLNNQRWTDGGIGEAEPKQPRLPMVKMQ